MAIRDAVTKLIQQPLKTLGYELSSLTFRKEGKDYVLRVVIDKRGIIKMDDIILAGELVSPLLDEADLIKTPYLLDVTSPGAEKEVALADLSYYLGERVNITLRQAIGKETALEGILQKIGEDDIELLLDTKKKETVTISCGNIAKARLAIKI